MLQYSEVVEADDEKACQDQDLGADESNVKNFYNYLVDAYEQFMDGKEPDRRRVCGVPTTVLSQDKTATPSWMNSLTNATVYHGTCWGRIGF